MSQCVLAKLLNERGHETVCFENAEQAILAYQKEFHPLVFVDVDLPGMDGVQFCRWLRSQPEGAKTYIMLAYSAGNPEEVHGMLGAGASDFLPKPFEVGGLKLRLDVAERQMNAFFHEKELEEDLRRQAEESEGLQSELCRAGDSLAKEVEERRKLEDHLEEVNTELIKEREVLDQKLNSQAEELCSAAEKLQSVTSFRTKVEDDLKHVRTELETQAGRHAKAAEALRKELAQEKSRAREGNEQHRQGMEALQAKLRDAIAASRKAEERRQAVEAEGRRMADSYATARSDWEQQQHDLVKELSTLRERVDTAAEQRTSKEVEQLTARCAALQEQLTKAREDFSQRIQVHTQELMRLDAELQKTLDVRRKAESGLVEARETMAHQAKDYASAVMKGGEDVEKAVAERVRVVQEADQEHSRLQQELRDRQNQIEELHAIQARLEKERAELEQELQKAWLELEQRPKNGEAGDQQVRQALTAAQQALGEEQEQRQRLEQTLQTERARVQERLRKFAAGLDPSEEALVPAA